MGAAAVEGAFVERQAADDVATSALELLTAAGTAAGYVVLENQSAPHNQHAKPILSAIPTPSPNLQPVEAPVAGLTICLLIDISSRPAPSEG